MATTSGGLTRATVQPQPPGQREETAFIHHVFPKDEPSVFPVDSGHGPLRKRPWAKARTRRLIGRSRKAAIIADLERKRRKTMMHTATNSIHETLDAAWDEADDIHDLIQTTPLVFDADGLPVGYDASQLFDLEAAYLGGRA
jgi:hypothetical protein